MLDYEEDYHVDEPTPDLLLTPFEGESVDEFAARVTSIAFLARDCFVHATLRDEVQPIYISPLSKLKTNRRGLTRAVENYLKYQRLDKQSTDYARSVMEGTELHSLPNPVLKRS
jgi:hypothetical protein